MPDDPPDERAGTTYVLAPDAEALRRRDALWAETPRGPGDPPLPEQRPDRTVGLAVDRTSVPFALTYAAAFGLIRGLYIRDGERGVEAFFRANGMVARRNPGDREGGGDLEPEDVLGGDLRVAYLLLREARRRVEKLGAEHVRRLEGLAAADAIARLERAHAQIEGEVRYLQGPGIEAGSALDERVSATLYSLRATSAVTSLLAELGRCRALVARVDAAGEALRMAHGEALSAAISDVGPFAFASPGRASGGPVVVPNQIANEAVMRAVEADPAVRARREAFDGVEAELEEQLIVAGQAHPVLFRIYREADPRSRAGVARAIVAALRRAHSANHELRRDLASDAADVWRFPPSVRETLMDAGVPDASITWTAAEERMEREQGPRLASQLGLVSGLAAGGAVLLAAAPPVAIAIALADVVINAIDALQEYLAYRTLRAGFDAVLDPSLAPGTEPGLLGTVLTIVLDLASVVPIPGGRGVTRALAP